MNRRVHLKIHAGRSAKAVGVVVGMLGVWGAILLGGQVAGAVDHGDTAGAGDTFGSSPAMDAALVTPDFGWVLTPDRLLTSSDGGTTFSDAHVPLPASEFRSAYFADAHSGVVVAAQGPVVKVARTRDGGATWTSSELPNALPFAGAEYSDLTVSFADARNGAVLARHASGPNFSIGTLFTTADGGASWTAHRAPVAGKVRVQTDGHIWLAGGVFGDQLYQSSDDGATWSQARLTPLPGRQISAVSPPSGGQLAVTALADGATEVEILGTSDHGQTWQEIRSVPVAGKTARGVRVPVVLTDAGQLVIDTAGGHAYRPDTRADIRPNGLPEGVDRVAFTPDGQSGWALAVHGRCLTGKTNCTLSHDLVRTVDGGASWRRLQVWDQKLG